MTRIEVRGHKPRGATTLGYASLAQHLCYGLEKHGVRVTDDAPVVLFVGAAGIPLKNWGAREGQYKVLVTMWETSRLPEAFQAYLHNFDLILVPNTYNVAQFGQHHPNVKHFTFGYDESVWRPTTRVYDGPLKFLMGGYPPDRKGFDLAVEAFPLAFPNWEKEDIRLVVRSRRPPVAPFVTPITQQLPLEDLVKLHHECHAYLAPSRGEGFHLQPAQALATGMWAILSDCPGHEWAPGLPGALMVPCEEKPVPRSRWGDVGTWWEAGVDSLAKSMRLAAESPVLSKDETTTIRATHARHRMARSVLQAIGEPQSSTRGEWRPFTQKTFPLEVTRTTHCTVGTQDYDFIAGNTYQVPAEVKRVMADAGYGD